MKTAQILLIFTLISTGIFAQTGDNSFYFDDYSKPKYNVIYTDLATLLQPTFTLGYGHYFDKKEGVDFFVNAGLAYTSTTQEYKFYFLEDEYYTNYVSYIPESPGISFFLSGKIMNDDFLGTGVGLSYKHMKFTTCTFNDYYLTIIPYHIRHKKNFFLEVDLNMGLRHITYEPGTFDGMALWEMPEEDKKNLFYASFGILVGYMF